MTSPAATATALNFTASPETLDHITALVATVRPGWDPSLVKVVLMSHRDQVNGNDLAIAALRCAANPDMPSPKSIGWRGPHWRDLNTMPLDVVDPDRCEVCGKPEPRCYSDRPGVDDDHEFIPAPRGKR